MYFSNNFETVQPYLPVLHHLQSPFALKENQKHLIAREIPSLHHLYNRLQVHKSDDRAEHHGKMNKRTQHQPNLTNIIEDPTMGTKSEDLPEVYTTGIGYSIHIHGFQY